MFKLNKHASSLLITGIILLATTSVLYASGVRNISPKTQSSASPAITVSTVAPHTNKGVTPAEVARAKAFRNVYGYIYGVGTATGAISSVRVRDNQTGAIYYGFVQWSAFSPQGLRWYCNNLPTNKGYTVTVVPNGFPDQAQQKSFYLPSQYNNDQRVDDFNFSIN
jgi:hypothetical protein